MPVIDAISDPDLILEDSGENLIALRGIEDGDALESQAITVIATSNNINVIPPPIITYSTGDTIGTLAYTPVADAFGSADITVMVIDDGGTADGGVDTTTTTFKVRVDAVNDDT